MKNLARTLVIALAIVSPAFAAQSAGASPSTSPDVSNASPSHRETRPQIRQLADGQQIFTQLVNAGDLEGLVSLYEKNATVVHQGKEYQGHEAIRGVLMQYLALRPTLRMTTLRVTENGNHGVTQGKWRLTGTAPDGTPVELSGLSTEMSTRQADGSWLYTIDLTDLPDGALSATNTQ